MVNRFQNQTRPNLPFNVQSCIIVPPYTITLIGEPFLHYDSGSTDPNRILVFYSDSGLASFASSAHLYADETFDTVPRIFFQLYTIYADIFGCTFPCVYILFSHKNRATYDNIFAHLN